MNSEDRVSEICSSDGGGGGGGGDSQSGHSEKRPLVSGADDDDVSDVTVIERPANFVPRSRKRARNVVEALNSECCILDSNPDDIVAVSETSGNDAELTVTAERGEVACRDYPHSRDYCAKFPFRSTPHEKHCGLCHCYVCDKLAPCLSWGKGNSTSDHCHASDKEEKWKKLRHSYKLKKTQMASPTTFMIANKLSTPMSSTTQVSRSNPLGTGAVASVPLNISHNAVPLIGGSNQPRIVQSANTLNFFSPASHVSSFAVFPHMPGWNERIAQTGSMPASSLRFSGHVKRCQLVGGPFPLNISCNTTQSVGPTQISSSSSTINPNFPSNLNPFCGFTNVPYQSPRMLASCLQREVPNSGIHGQGTMATTTSHGSRRALVEGNWAQRVESFDALLSSNKQSTCHVPRQFARFSQIKGTVTRPIQRNMPNIASHNQDTMATGSHESQPGFVEGNQMQKMEPLNALLLSNEQSMLHIAGQIPRLGQTGSMLASSMQRDASNTGLGSMATRPPGSQAGSVGGNQKHRMGLLNVSSSSISRDTLEVCSSTHRQVVYPCSTGQGNLNDAQLNTLQEFLLGSDSEDNFCIQDESFTDIFRNCIIDQCSNSEVLPMIQPSASGHLSSLCVSSTCGLRLLSRPGFSGDMGSIIHLPAVQQMLGSSIVLDETNEQRTNAPDH